MTEKPDVMVLAPVMVLAYVMVDEEADVVVNQEADIVVDEVADMDVDKVADMMADKVAAWSQARPLEANQGQWEPTNQGPGSQPICKSMHFMSKSVKILRFCLLCAKILFTSQERFFIIFTLGAKSAFCGSLAGRWCALHCAVCIF